MFGKATGGSIAIYIIAQYIPYLLTHCRRDKIATIYSDYIVSLIFVNEIFCILNAIPLTIIPKGPKHSKLPLVQIITGRRTGDKLSSQLTVV